MLVTTGSKDYELLDSGEGEKLERFGDVVLSRPDPQALWRKRSPQREWEQADGRFGKKEGKMENGKWKDDPSRPDKEERGEWHFREKTPERWPIGFEGLKFWIRPSSFKHVGIFPEQAANWEWAQAQIEKEKIKKQNNKDDIEVLNLFGYTGGATLACAKAGAKVVHIDGSKTAMAWARDNAELSGLTDRPVRWIVEDARAFVRREIKRGRKYDGIIMDPPSFGHGPSNELWKIEEHFLPLLDDCIELLNDKPLFFLLNGYAAGYSATAYRNALMPLAERFGGEIEAGELAIEEGKMERWKEAKIGRLLSCGIFARWAKEKSSRSA